MEGLEINRRIGLLRAKVGLSGKEFAERLGIKRSTVNNWETGNYNVKADDIENICKTFPVSADWLLGLVPENQYSSDEDVKKVSAFTGLSTEAVERLHDCVLNLEPGNSYFEIVSNLLSGSDFYTSIAYLKRAARTKAKVSEDMASCPESFEVRESFVEALSDHEVMSSNKRGVRLSSRQSIEFFIQRSVDCFKTACDYIVKGGSK